MILPKSKRLKKELNLIDVYALATGTTLSAGFFILPGLAAQQAGPALILSYFLAFIPLIPAVLSMIELATAMPRAGGAYYFLDRSMGPLIGTIGGLGTWLAMILKTALALIGMGAYLNLFVHGNYLIPTALVFTAICCVLNLKGVKETGILQIVLVVGIIILLAGFIGNGLFHIDSSRFSHFFHAGGSSIMATAGLVYISYAGLTKITSIAEEVHDPEKNLPLGMLLALLTTVIIYGLGTYVMVGVLPIEQLKGSLTPVAIVADSMFGLLGKIFVTIAAVLAFFSMTNVGILSASRYPLAMSRDHLLPKIFHQFNKKGVPIYSIFITVALIIFFMLFLNPMKIAKLASAFQLFIFALCCFAVIIMRESHIESYDPGYRSPFYPWLQIFGIILPFWFIFEMGWMSILFSLGLVGVCIIWYYSYAHRRIVRGGAILHVFERLGRARYEGLDPELRSILKEKGLRAEDPFVELVIHSRIIDLEHQERFDEIIKRASKILAEETLYPQEKIMQEIMDGTKIGATPVSHGAALPHMRLQHISNPKLVLIRSKEGVDVDIGKDFWGEHIPQGPIFAIFFLISPEGDPSKHLRILAKIANRVDDDNFISQWLAAENEHDLREVLLKEEHFMNLYLQTGTPSAELIGKILRELKLPDETLIAVIHRGDQTIVPRGATMLQKNDHLTIIGNQEGIKELRKHYGSDI